MKKILLGVLLLGCLFAFDVLESVSGVTVRKEGNWFQIDFVNAAVPSTNPSISFSLVNGAFDRVYGEDFTGTSSNVTTMSISYKQYSGGAAISTNIFTLGTALTAPATSFITFTIPNYDTTPNIINGTIYGTVK